MAVAIAFTLLFVFLVGYGLQRNERRQAGPRPPLAGSSGTVDRDLQRIREELAAAGSRDTVAPAPVPAAHSKPKPRGRRGTVVRSKDLAMH